MAEPCSWCCVYTHHNEETRAAGSLDAMGYEPYLPRLGTEKMMEGKKVMKWEALFPRYLFVCLPLEGHWQPATRARGVVRLMGPPNAPSVLPDEFMGSLFLRCGDRAEEFDRIPVAAEALKFERGDKCQIASGSGHPFASWQGIAQRTKKDRVTLLLSLFGRSTEVEVKNSDLVKC